jgi:hypothetical protein
LLDLPASVEAKGLDGGLWYAEVFAAWFSRREADEAMRAAMHMQWHPARYTAAPFNARDAAGPSAPHARAGGHDGLNINLRLTPNIPKAQGISVEYLAHLRQVLAHLRNSPLRSQ